MSAHAQSALRDRFAIVNPQAQLVSPGSTQTSFTERALFAVVWLYFASFSVVVPIIDIGLSWAVWPLPTDVVVVLGLCVLLADLMLRKSQTGLAGPLIPAFWLFFSGAILSFIILTVDPFDLRGLSNLTGKGEGTGLFHIYRLAQASIVCWCVQRIDFSAARVSRLVNAIAFVLTFNCATVALDYLDIISTTLFSSHLPTSIATSGPWAAYRLGVAHGSLGAVGYHHVLVPLQILICTTLLFTMKPHVGSGRSALMLGAALICCALTSSRAGFVTAAIFLALFFIRNRKPALIVLVVLLAVLLVVGALNVNTEWLDKAVNRHSTISSSYQVDGVAGRTQLWGDRLTLLLSEPRFLLTGTGFGSAIQSGSNAHMIYLHVLLELGVPGLALFLSLFVLIFRELRALGNRGYLFAALTVSLLISGLTQETFYPVPALQHFVGLYMVSLLLVLKTQRQPRFWLRTQVGIAESRIASVSTTSEVSR